MWERSFAKWCDNNFKITKWAIEPFSINYFDVASNKHRRYFPDFFIEYDNKKIVVEVKPEYQTVKPLKYKTGKVNLIAERTYLTNTSKWESAKSYCEVKGWSFWIVTEKTLEALGINIIQPTKTHKKKYKKRRTKKKI